MSDGFRKVRPGEPVRVASQAWNKIIDQVVTKPRFDGNTSAPPQTNFRVRVRNNTSTGIPRWGVLQVSNILEAPTGVGSQFEQWPGVIGSTPASGPEGGVSYVVAVDPIPAGSIGQGAIDGVVQSRVLVLSTGHQYAKPKAGEVDYLETADSGPFRIIWKGATGPSNPTGVTGPTKPWALLSFEAASSVGVKLGTFTGSWAIGETSTVTFYSGTGPTSTAAVENYTWPLGGCSLPETDCVVGNDGVGWLLLSPDLSSLASYNEDNIQLLGHTATGCLRWYDIASCATGATGATG
jgi:hypothetical protein